MNLLINQNLMLIMALLLIGFSIFCSVLLMMSSLFNRQSGLQTPSLLGGFVLLLSLALLQFFHLGQIYSPGFYINEQLYALLLFLVAPAFYFFSRQLLVVNGNFKRLDMCHLFPLPASVLLPFGTAFPLAFILGSCYLLWLAKTVYTLRDQRQRFQYELLALALLFVIAVCVLFLAFSQPLMSRQAFYIFYSILIGLAIFIAAFTLLKFPAITQDVQEAVQANYVASTLKNINCDDMTVRLTRLMTDDRLYRNEQLNLAVLAQQLEMTPHQLSELINTRFGKGFSQFIREYRINEAKQLLMDEPHASVLSIGLSVGFTSQSNFYSAFQNITGMAPGKFRKQHQQHDFNT